MVRTLDVDFVEQPDVAKTRDIAEILTKARVHYDQVTPTSKGQSLNVSSYTDNSAGDYTSNWSFTWTISTYCCFRQTNSDNPRSTSSQYCSPLGTDSTKSTTALDGISGYSTAASGGAFDSDEVAGVYAGE